MKTQTVSSVPDDLIGDAALAHQENAWDDLLIHAWVSQLILEASGLYVSRQNARSMPMQTGQALLGFLQIFGNVKDEELHRLIQSLHRFTESDDPLAVVLFKALVNLSTEHDSQGDFLGVRAPDITERPRSAAIWMRESLERWCDWIDAVIHLQTHSQWHLAPECFDSDPAKREATTRAINQRYLAQMRRLGMADWRTQASDSTQFCKEMPTWQMLPPPAISQPQRPWPHPELDEAIVTLWPLVKRHNWSYTDLLNVLRDLVDSTDAYPSQNESNLATYCTRALHLRKAWLGKTAKMDRPIGYVVALKLCPPALPPAISTFGDRAEIEPVDYSRMEPFELFPGAAEAPLPAEQPVETAERPFEAAEQPIETGEQPMDTTGERFHMANELQMAQDVPMAEPVEIADQAETEFDTQYPEHKKPSAPPAVYTPPVISLPKNLQ